MLILVENVGENKFCSFRHYHEYLLILVKHVVVTNFANSDINLLLVCNDCGLQFLIFIHKQTVTQQFMYVTVYYNWKSV